MSWNTDSPRSRASNRLPFAIMAFPNEWSLSKDDSKNNITDSTLVSSQELPKKYRFQNAVINAIAAFFIPMPFLAIYLELTLNPPGPAILAYLLAQTLLLYLIFRASRRNSAVYVVFDRTTQTVTLPKGLRNRPVEYPFEKVIPIVGTTFVSGLPSNQYFGLKRPRRSGGFRMPQILMFNRDDTPSQTWSFIVWYMDRNRPLPPSAALDEYRTRDNERRRRDGNQEPYAPMYPQVVQKLREYNAQRTARGLAPIEELAHDTAPRGY